MPQRRKSNVVVRYRTRTEPRRNEATSSEIHSWSSNQMSPPASKETKLNIWLNIAAILVPLVTIGLGGLYELGNVAATIKGQIADQSKDIDIKLQPLATKVGEVSAKVDSAAKDAQSKVDLLSNKVDANNTLTQTKQDILSESIKNNQQDQSTFRTNVQTLFSKVFDSQQKLADQINQERVDRLSVVRKP